MSDMVHVANTTVEKIAQYLSDNSHTEFCVGFHLRHVLDVDTPTVAIAASSKHEADVIREHNERLGLHTLNHVVDSLLYSASPGAHDADGKRPLSFRVDIRFDTDPATCHAFDRVIDVEHDAQTTHLHCVVPPEWSLRACEFDTEVERFLYTTPAVAGNHRWSSPYDGFVCGAQKLCTALGISNPGPLAYRSIIASVLQLAEYARKFGPFTRTYLLRERDFFGCGVGITVLCKDDPPPGIHAEVEKALLDALRWAKGIVDAKDRDSVPPANPGIQSIASQIADSICRDSGMDGSNWRKKLLRGAIGSYLNFCTSFCDEQLEGRALRFAIVLGHPKLFKHWPGSAPLLLPTNIDIAKQVHLIEGPEERMIVVPYGSPFGRVGTPFAVDLADLGEALDSHANASLWDAALRPSVYFTDRYPWAISTVVGPNSEMRIFVRGQLVFYRDGKGWRSYVGDDELSKMTWLDHARVGEPAPDGYSAGLGLLLSFCQQLSPIARPPSHGALVLWIPHEDEQLEPILHANTIQLGAAEPESSGGDRADAQKQGTKWLTGRPLLRPHGRGVPGGVDPAVARLVIRAAMVDGAIVLVGPSAKVWGFARQLNFKACEAGAAGTKRAAARAAVSALRGYQGTVAIAVSSDGPLRLFFSDKCEELFPLRS